MRLREYKVISVYISIVFALMVTAYAMLFFTGSDRWYRLWYYVPAGALAGGFIGCRIKSGLWSGWRKDGQWKRAIVLDILVALTCLARPLVHWPPASGHALFGVYTLLTCRDRFVRILAVILLLITLYAKLYLWHGDTTLWSGLALGLIASALFKISLGKSK